MTKIKDTLTSILLILIVFWFVIHNVIEPKVITTPNLIYNAEKNENLKTYLAVALNAYGIRDIKIGIRYLTPKEQVLLSSPFAYTRAITQLNNGIYVISLIPTSEDETIRLIAHEIVHVKQLYDKRIVYNDTAFYWKGKNIINNIPPYKQRPWEIEALHKEDSIAEVIKDVIY